MKKSVPSRLGWGQEICLAAPRWLYQMEEVMQESLVAENMICATNTELEELL